MHRRPDRSCVRRHRGGLDRAGRRGPGDRRRASTTTRRRDARRRPRGRRGSTRTGPCSSTATGCSRPGSRRSTAAAGARRMTGAVPAERFAERLDGARAAAAAAGLDALLVGVGAELRYLTGYLAMPLERLTLLVIPSAAGAPVTLIAPRLEATPARTCAAAAAGHVTVATWEETEDPMRLVATTLEAGLGRPAADVGGGRRLGRAARRLRPRAAAGPAGRALLARVGGAPRAADAQGPGRGRAAAAGRPCRRPGDRRDRRRAAGRSHRGRRRETRSGSGCSPRATRSPSSGSSRRGPTARRRTTSRASG